MAPEGRAVRTDGGYRVTGCWHYATGAPYATTFLANCTLAESDRPKGQPNTRAVLLESSQVSIVPSWDASGLRGTGSDDFEVRDVFVPEQKTFALAQPAAREPGALYRLPFTAVMELSIVAVALGIAQHILDEFAAMTRHKKGPAEGAPLADDPGAQARYAEARATWGLMKAGLDALSLRVWRDALAIRTPSHIEASEVTAASALSVVKLRSAVGELVALAGMNAIQPDSELARAWRDLQALAAHTAVSPRNLAKIGATLLAVSDSLAR